jgi:predicted aspartyl protease
MSLSLFFVAALWVSAHAYNVRRVEPTTNAALLTEILPAAQFSLPLTEKVPRSTYKKDLLKTLRGRGSTVLAGSSDDSQYLTVITVGGQKFKVIVDTGS